MKFDQKTLIAANEIINELILSTVNDDNKLKKLDTSIDPSSISYSVHLALTLKELINGSNE